MFKYNVKGKEQWKISVSHDEVSSGNILPESRRNACKLYTVSHPTRYYFSTDDIMG
jgi:uncharacterized protein (DUF427 family)